MALTDATVKTAKPKEKDCKLSDADGLYLFVRKAGGKLWRMKYRYDIKEKLLSFRAYPAITLLKARNLRDQAREHLANNLDPSEVNKIKKAEKSVNEQHTFEHWAKRWLIHWQNDKSPFHVASTQRRLKRYIPCYWQ